MKNFILLGLLLAFMIGCSSSKNGTIVSKNESTASVSDTIRIANSDLEYEVIIIDPGFSSWLVSHSKPIGYYSESYLESRNRIYIREWNNRVLQPFQYNPNLYEMQINYDNNIHYGYEVNYLIYNYMQYFQITNKQQLTGFVPRP